MNAAMLGQSLLDLQVVSRAQWARASRAAPHKDDVAGIVRALTRQPAWWGPNGRSARLDDLPAAGHWRSHRRR